MASGAAAMSFPNFGNEPPKPKSCAHGYTIDDQNPRQLCPFCPQPNRAKIVKAWEKMMATKFHEDREPNYN